MVFTGSIGLHNVIAALKDAGYANAPINDMKIINVSPLAPEDGQELARALLEGEAIETVDRNEIAQTIASAVDSFPYYIHQIVDDLKFHEGVVDADAVEEVVLLRLTDEQDDWDFWHYRKRIDTYYAAEQRPLALALLDVLAHGDVLPFDGLFNQVKIRIELADEEAERVRAMLVLLQRDHYIMLDRDGTYRFRFPLIRRWWQLHRG